MTDTKTTTGPAPDALDVTDVHGPIDFLLLEFSADKATPAAGALLELVERGIVRN
jgi:hypothetical protein